MKSLRINRSDSDVSKLVRTLRNDAKKKEEFFDYIISGPILEIGCGSGQVLKKISRAFPHAKLYGLDADPRLIKIAKRKHIPNCTFFQSLAQNSIILPAAVRNVIFPASLHEIVSFSNKDDISQLFRNVHSYLARDGVVIIWEGIRSDYGNVTISNSPTIPQLLSFAKKFEYKKYFWKKSNDSQYSVSFDLLAEYVTKKDRLDIPMEYKETHFPLSQSEYESLLRSTGFEIVVLNNKPLHQKELQWLYKNFKFEKDISNVPVYTLIVAKKSRSINPL